jgi:hypothetical protein
MELAENPVGARTHDTSCTTALAAHADKATNCRWAGRWTNRFEQLCALRIHIEISCGVPSDLRLDVGREGRWARIPIVERCSLAQNCGYRNGCRARRLSAKADDIEHSIPKRFLELVVRLARSAGSKLWIARSRVFRSMSGDCRSPATWDHLRCQSWDHPEHPSPPADEIFGCASEAVSEEA